MKKIGMLFGISLILIIMSFFNIESISANELTKVEPTTSFKFFKKAKATYAGYIDGQLIEFELSYDNMTSMLNGLGQIIYKADILKDGKDITVYSNENVGLSFGSDGLTILSLPADYSSIFPTTIYVEGKAVKSIDLFQRSGRSAITLKEAYVEEYPVLKSNSGYEMCSYKVDQGMLGTADVHSDAKPYLGSQIFISINKFNQITAEVLTGSKSEDITDTIIHDGNAVEFLTTMFYDGKCPVGLKYNVPGGRTHALYFYDSTVRATQPSGWDIGRQYLPYASFNPEVETLMNGFASLQSQIVSSGLCVTSHDKGKFDGLMGLYSSLESKLYTVKSNVHLSSYDSTRITGLEKDALKIKEDLQKIVKCLEEKGVLSEEAAQQLNDTIEKKYESMYSTFKEIHKGIGANDNPLTCDDIDNELLDLIKTGFFVVQILAVVLTVILSIVDFAKAAIGMDSKTVDGGSTAFKTAIKRIIACVILIVIPIILSLILNLAGIQGFGSENICI